MSANPQKPTDAQIIKEFQRELKTACKNNDPAYTMKVSENHQIQYSLGGQSLVIASDVTGHQAEYPSNSHGPTRTLFDANGTIIAQEFHIHGQPLTKEQFLARQPGTLTLS